jgi:hypothetical protein
MFSIASLFAILLLTFHISEDIVRGFEPGGFKNVQAAITVLIWLCGVTVLAGRRSGYIISLLGSLLGSVVPMAHMRGAGFVGGRIANSGGKLFWVWTLLALEVAAFFCVILSARALWAFRWRRRKTE